MHCGGGRAGRLIVRVTGMRNGVQTDGEQQRDHRNADRVCGTSCHRENRHAANVMPEMRQNKVRAVEMR